MKILIVEDDQFFQKFYVSKLQEDGYSVDIAINGEEGLLKIQSTYYDVILLDLIMPKMDGFELLKTIASQKIKHGSILVFSTLGQKDDVIKAKELGASEYVNKSFFDYDVLRAKIKSLVKIS